MEGLKLAKFRSLFGDFNELEVSRNVPFEGPVAFQDHPLVRSIDRHYYTYNVTLYYGPSTDDSDLFELSLDPDASKESLDVKFVIRLDTTPSSPENIQKVSAKIKFFQYKDTLFDFNSMIAHETDFADVSRFSLLHCPPSCTIVKRAITFWTLSLDFANQTFRFKVAFRSKKTNDTQCNLECEGARICEMPGSEVKVILDILAKYYRVEHENGNAIRPLIPVEDLSIFNPHEQRTVRSMKLTDEEEPAVANEKIDAIIRKLVAKYYVEGACT